MQTVLIGNGSIDATLIAVGVYGELVRPLAGGRYDDSLASAGTGNDCFGILLALCCGVYRHDQKRPDHLLVAHIVAADVAHDLLITALPFVDDATDHRK